VYIHAHMRVCVSLSLCVCVCEDCVFLQQTPSTALLSANIFGIHFKCIYEYDYRYIHTHMRACVFLCVCERRLRISSANSFSFSLQICGDSYISNTSMIIRILRNLYVYVRVCARECVCE